MMREELTQLALEMESAKEISPALRKRFIAARTELFRRGLYDPILVRFDSATVPPAGLAEVASELRSIAEGL